MRFGELSLERYGVYEKLSVPLTSPGLTVVYGPNEAGKSTCLSAISDLLFGIPNNSSHGQRFGYDAMRIGAVLLVADGKRLELQRRKGHRQTLLDESGKAIDDSILRTLLGTVTRDRFETLFGIDHRSLTQGGENLLKAEGDIGRLIVEAGGGLRSLLDRIKELEQEADSLFAFRRSESRKFYKVYDQFAAADKEVKDATLTFDTYRQTREHLSGARKKHQELTESRKEREREQSAMERAHRVLPVLGQLVQIDQEIESYVDVLRLRPEFANDVEITIQEREHARKDLNDVAKRCGDLENQMNELLVDQVLLDSEAAIRTIHEKSLQVVREREDRPKREKELAEQNARLVRLREYLKLSPDADLKERVPQSEMQGLMRQLVSKGQSLVQLSAQFEKRIEDNESHVNTSRNKQHELQGQGFDRSLIIDVAGLKTLPRLLRETEDRNQRASKFEEEINCRLTTLGTGTIEDVRNFRCPDLDTIVTEIKRRGDLQKQIEDHRTNLRQAEGKFAAAIRTIERLQAAGEVPTDTAIDQARFARRNAWQPIRAAYISSDPDAVRSIPRAGRESNVNLLEARIDDADRLADRKSAEAQRLTDLAAAEKERDEGAIAIESWQKACKEVEDRFTDQCRRFSETWSQAMQIESDLDRLKQMVTVREEALQRADEAKKLREEIKVRQDEVNAALATFALAENALGLHPDSNAKLEQRLFELEQTTNVHKLGHDEWVRNNAKLEELDSQLAESRGELEKLKTQHSHWQRDWNEAISQIGLSVNSGIQFVEQVISEWSDAGAALALVASTQHRLSQFDHDETDLSDRIGKLSLRLSFTVPDDSVAATKMLSERLEKAKQLDTQRKTLARQLKEATADRESKFAQLDNLNRRIQGLCNEADTDESILATKADRVRELIQKRQSREQKLAEIRAGGDGKGLDVLRSECKGLDPDTTRAELDRIRSDKEHLDQEIQQAYAEMKSHEREIGQFSIAAGVNGAESRRQSAAAEMRTIIERYVEVKLAREILDQAINRVREERQDPLINRAGELFRLATRDSFVGIATDVDDHGNPVVVGKRASGELVQVALMSDGTRDQLFLAFRIASIEQYCEQAEPLPFVADDLLVHFDDERSFAAIELMTELARTTQVLLFTHHRSVREMAQRLAAEKNASIKDLAICATQ